MLHEENAKTLRESLQHVHVNENMIHAKDKIIKRGEQLIHKFHHHRHHHHVDNNNGGDGYDKHDIHDKHDGDVMKDNKDFITSDHNNNKETGGFIVLGMHRSGTSMLAGLLVEGFGYKPGEPLIQPAYDNEKGFYELIPAVLQNDIFMSAQHIDWATNVRSYDADLALKDYNKGLIEFEKGEKALKVLNDKANRPYLQKDPR